MSPNEMHFKTNLTVYITCKVSRKPVIWSKMVMRILNKSINKSCNLLIINKLHFLFSDLFTVYDYIYFWIQRNALKENLTINDYGAKEISIILEVGNKRTCMLCYGRF